MNAHTDVSTSPPADFSRWRNVPLALIVLGGIGVLFGILAPSKHEQFGYSWLLAFMFFLSLMLGALFLVIVHHLFDASWSVPIRRITENMACLAPVMLVFFIPIGILATRIYPWMTIDPHTDHALHAKLPMFTKPMFYVIAAICFGLWWLLSSRLRYWSLEQDTTGSALCTHKMRFYAYWGIFAFALTLTLGAIMWMKSLQHQWFSTMYGVYYFSGSVWMTLATVYLLTRVFQQAGPLRNVVHETQYYFLGSLLFAFTVFYAYIHFSQYFIIWNANIPEETFWYKLRENGTWWDIGMVIIFGHFFLPFVLLLRIDVKLSWLMAPIGIWAWLMHFVDLSFNIMPAKLHPNNFHLDILDLACLAFMGGVLAKVFLAQFAAHPAFPQKDPRFAESQGIYVPPVAAPVKPLSAGGRTK